METDTSLSWRTSARLFEDSTAVLSNARFAPSDSPLPRSATDDLLPTVGLFDSTLAAAGATRAQETERRTERLPPVSVDETEPPPSSRRWTMAVNLTSSGSLDDNGARRPIGAAGKLDQILELAERSRNSPVTIYVQSTLPLPTEVSEDGTIRSNLNDLQVATYRIENGEVTLVERGPTQGFQRDLEQLLARASRRAGDGNLGLIIQSHGLASNGLSGDSGRVSLDELEGVIRNGLRSSGRTALDVLNFDSCDMGNIDVVQAMQGEARHIVGSAEVERAFGSDVDGQNMKATLGALFDDPALTPERYASRSIELARRGFNDDAGNLRPDRAGTETLAHFEVDRFPQVESSLDALGIRLGAIANSQEGRAILTEIITGIDPIGDRTISTALPVERRDLGLFLTSLQSALDEGRLQDANGEIAQSIRDLRQSLQGFIRDYHGEPYNRYDQMSGMSVFLPGNEILNLDEGLRRSTAISQILENFTPGGKGVTHSSRSDLADNLLFHVEQLREYTETRPLAETIEQIRNAADQTAMTAAMVEFRQQIEALRGGPIEQAMVDRSRRDALQARERVFQTELRRMPANWRAFISSLRLS